MQIFKLGFDKKWLRINIEPWRSGWIDKNKDYSEPYRFNEGIYICADRKKLNKLAKEIQEQWIKETEEELEEIKNIKIKRKY